MRLINATSPPYSPARFRRLDALAAQVIVVAAVEVDDALRCELDDARRERRHEFAIVADEYQRAWIIREREV